MTLPRDKPAPPPPPERPAGKKPIAVPAAADAQPSRGQAEGQDSPRRCAIGPMAITQFGQVLDVEGVEMPFAGALASFLDLADYRHACCMVIDTGDFARFHSAVMEHMRQRFGPASGQVLAVSYARLICFSCGVEYDQSRLGELRRAGRAAAANDPAGGPGASPGGVCEACGKSESLYVYDNLASDNVTKGDIETLRAYWRHHARLWWSTRQPEPQPCFACGDPVLPGHGFSRGGNLYCPRCACREGDVERLRCNPHYFGSGELTKARAFGARQTQDS